jgi:hypothetical protein
MKIVALSGKINPLGARYLSLAYRTVSNIDSYSKKYPIHSEIMMSTFGNGSSTSSIFPCRRVILSDIPFTATISRAFSMMVDMSTPITCLAPARTANL